VSYKELAPSFYNRVINVVREVGEGEKLLNVGCSDGFMERKLQGKFSKMVGLDINAADIEVAKSGKANEMEFIVGAAEKLPFPANTFGKIICMEVLEHVEDDRKALAEMYRVLKKNGELILTVPQRKYPWTFDPINAFLEKVFRFHLPLGVWGYGDDRVYTDAELRKLFGEAGFKISGTRYVSHYFLGLCENYISQILQPLVKADPSNKAGRGKAAISRDKHPPKILTKIRDFVIAADERLFPESKTSIDILVRAVK